MPNSLLSMDISGPSLLSFLLSSKSHAMHFLLQLCILFTTAWNISGKPVIPSSHEVDHQALQERNQVQIILNPCPEDIEGGDGIQFCETKQCGGDTNITGVCNNIRLNGPQDRRCQFVGGCGSYCRCIPWSSYAPVFGNGPSVSVQCIGIECPETYGLPLQKCSAPSCGGSTASPGWCNNVLVTGCQVPFCPKPGCGTICRCDPNDDDQPPPSSDIPNATTIWLSGTTTETVRGLVYLLPRFVLILVLSPAHWVPLSFRDLRNMECNYNHICSTGATAYEHNQQSAFHNDGRKWRRDSDHHLATTSTCRVSSTTSGAP